VAFHCAIDGYSFSTYDADAAETFKWQQAYALALTADFPILFINTETFSRLTAKVTRTLDLMIKGRTILLAVDESSDIKGNKALRSVNLVKIGQRCGYRMILTGTEITNSVLDLYQQFEFLKPGFWGFRSFFFFKKHYAVIEERHLSGGRSFPEVVGFRKLNEIQDRIAPFVSRASTALLNLPDKIYQPIKVGMTGECARVYAELKKHLITMLESGEYVTVANKVALFTKFRQITGGTLAGVGVIEEGNAKLQALMDELVDHGEQAIVWSCFTEEINLLVRSLSRLCGVVRFDGQVSDAGRQEAIDKFRSGEARLFIANPAAASQGLNLQNAHIQYWYSLPTQAKHYEQGEGRIHRSGQTQACLYKSILCEGTVDYRIAQILKEKTDVMSSFRDGTIHDVLELI
jgi:SNF2 family DNA or RNA helicase